MKITHISDTHGLPLYKLFKERVGGLLVHSGDALNSGDEDEFYDFLDYLDDVREFFDHILFVPGNHDIYVGKNLEECRRNLALVGVDMLIEESIVIDGVKFYGHNMAPWPFGMDNCPWVFLADPHSDIIKNSCAAIPSDTDILISHGPLYGYLDDTSQGDYYVGENAGCPYLTSRVKDLIPEGKLQAILHGHIHESYGRTGILGTDVEILNSALAGPTRVTPQPQTFNYIYK